MPKQPLTRPLIPLVLMLTLGQILSACSDPRFKVRTPPGEQVDVFMQASVPTVDVLWVVDNSSSMEEEQAALADNFPVFYKYLADLVDMEAEQEAFHIGVISTDIYDPNHQGKLIGDPHIITDATPQAGDVFAENVNVGLEGKGDEQGFRAAVLALSEPLISTDNETFLREHAHLFIIFVSDEDDRSFGEVPYFLRRFEQIKGIGNDGMVKVAAIVGDVPEVPEKCRTEKNVEPGERYAELAEATGGIVLSICDDDFATNLDQLGFSAAGLRRFFPLSRLAIPESIHVWVKTKCSAGPLPKDLCEDLSGYDDCNGSIGDLYGHICVLTQGLPNGWAYEVGTNSIRFYGDAVPPFGSVVEVGYIPTKDAD